MAAEEFNVLEHEHVPEHEVLSDEESAQVLKKYKVDKDQLPKIRKTDPVLQVLEEAYGEIPEGKIIKIIRQSPTAGISVAYRVVVKG